MEQLFRTTELETRFRLNMNVLDANGVPRVMTLTEVLRAYLDHRRDVLQRRTQFRLAEIARRLEVLEGLLIVYLNLDEVIRIIRNEDDPKAELMKRWKLNDLQADAILNMRLRALRKLEEMEIRPSTSSLTGEQKDLNALLEERAQAVAQDLRRDEGDSKKRSVRRPTWGAPHRAGRGAVAPRSSRSKRSSSASR